MIMKNNAKTFFSDMYAPILKKINEALMNGRQLNIPVSIVILTIKNLRRFYQDDTTNRTDEIIYSSGKIINMKLAEGDSSFRYDINKFVIILPGKDKKYAVTLGNIIKNEIININNTRNINLLIGVMCAAFPDEGTSAFELLDYFM